MRRISIAFALMLFTLLNVSVAIGSEPVKMLDTFRSSLNVIIADSDNLETYYYPAGKGYKLLYNYTTMNELDDFGEIGYTAGFISLTTLWDLLKMQELDPENTPFQCVGFVKAVTNLPSGEEGRPSYWVKGAVLEPTNLPEPGTAIATFFDDDGSFEGHTAIFLGGNSQKIIVIEQNNKGCGYISIRPIAFDGGSAGNYHVVEY